MVKSNISQFKILNLDQTKSNTVTMAPVMEFDPSELDPDDERSQEFSSIPYIFPELNIIDAYSASILINVSTDSPITVGFGKSSEDGDILETHKLTHLPPLLLQVTLPDGYPTENPPQFKLESEWIAADVKATLEAEIIKHWHDTHDYVLYDTIDLLQQQANRGFGWLDQDKWDESILFLDKELEVKFLAFNKKAIKEIFNQGTYSCGVCLEPKKGVVCHRLYPCGHVFCINCLKDFYSSCITEGDVPAVKCLEFSCILNKRLPTAQLPPPVENDDEDTETVAPKAVIAPTLRPEELEEIGLPPDLVLRYRLLKRKMALEADPATIYCPRKWCNAPSRWSLAEVEKQIGTRDFYLTEKHYEEKKAALENPPSLADLQITDEKPSEEAENPENPPEPAKEEAEERLDCCSSCGYAFCNVCLMGWHGEFVHCRPIPTVLTEEDIASIEYMKSFAAHCPTCDAPVIKSRGCNHMMCKCATHFCFLCSAYLDPGNPYGHYNNECLPCYQKLWVNEEGDQMGGHAPRPGDEEEDH